MTDQITVNQTLILLEDMFESPPLYGATFGDVLSNAVDEEISVSEDCLNLAVSTPVLPSNNPEVRQYSNKYYCDFIQIEKL